MRTPRLAIGLACSAAALLLHFPVLFGGGVRLALDQRLFPPWQATLTPKAAQTELAETRFNRLSTDSNFWHLGQIRSTVSQIRQGDYPAWDASTLCGTPLAAQLGFPPWYPPNWFLLAGDPLLLLGWLAAFHTVLAGFLMGRLLLRLGVSPGSALVGALAFCLGPWLLLRINNPSLLASAAWAPLAFEAALGIGSGSRFARHAVLLGAALALSFTAGMPQLGFVSLWGALGLGAMTAWNQESRRATRTAWLLCGAGLGVVLAAPAMLPAAIHVRDSIRAAPLEGLQALKLAPGALFGLLSCELFGGAADLAGWPSFQQFPTAAALLSDHVQDNPLENCIHPGGLVLFLASMAGAGLLGSWRKHGRGALDRLTTENRGPGARLWLPGPGTFLALGGAALLLAMRPALLDPLYRIPGLGPEEPRRVLLLLHLAWVAAGILGLEAALHRPAEARGASSRSRAAPSPWVLSWALWPGAVILGAWLFPGMGRALLEALLQGLEAEESERVLAFLGRALLWPGLAGAAGAVLLVGLRSRPRLVRLLCAGIVLLELLPLGWRTNPAPAAEQLDADGASRTMRFLKAASAAAGPEGLPRLLHVRCFHALQGNLISWQGIPVLSATNPFVPRRLGALLTLVEPGLIDTTSPRGVGWLRETASVRHPLLASARVGLFAATDLATALALEEEGLVRVFPPLGRETEHEGVALFQAPWVGPRARLAFEWLEVAGPDQARAVLERSPSTLVVESGAGTCTPKPVPPTAPTRVTWVAARPGLSELEVDSGGGVGLLVIADSGFSGWRARVDGRRRPLLRAGLAFQALAVGPGLNRITLEYRDPLSPVSLLFLFFGLAAAGWCWRSGRRPDPLPTRGNTALETQAHPDIHGETH